MEFVVWRIEALAAPCWLQPCPSCRETARFAPSSRFRVNANGGRLDVWLLYQCLGCDATAKRSVLRRTAVASIEPARLDAYHRNDAALAWRHAFEIATAEPLPHRVVRPPLPDAACVIEVRIEEPFACGVRFDALLAAELGWSRSRVARRFEEKRIEIERGATLPSRRPATLASRVRDGDVLRIAMP